MKKVNLFFLAIIFALNLVILPFSAIAVERADDESLDKVARGRVVKKCGIIDEDEFSKFINNAKYIASGESSCYDCKKGFVVEGRRGKCDVRIKKDAPGFYTVR